MQEQRVTKFWRPKPIIRATHDNIMKISRKALRRIFKYQNNGGYVFVAARNPFTGQWNERSFSIPLDWKEVREFQEKYDPEEFDHYYCPNAFAQPKRLARFALPTPYAWCDIDNADPLEFEPQPSMLVRTSPTRYQGLWQFKKALDPKLAQQYSRQLAYEWGGDRGGWSVTKMLRLPGTLNHKPAYNRPQVIIEWDDGPVFLGAPAIAGSSRIGPASKISIDFLRYESSAVIAKYKRQLLPSRKRFMEDTVVRNKDRSRIIFLIVASLIKAGAYPDEIGAVLWQSPYFISKHGHSPKKLTAEINRITSKLGAGK
jgi:RepB DNA-primase from phage plasmid